MNEGLTTTHHRACNLCEAICGLEIRVEDGAVTSIRGDELDPFSRGHICPKAVALQDIHADPDRLKRPLKRTGSGWREIGWEEALDEAAAGILRIQEERGRDAVGAYLGNPNVHNWGALLYGPPLLRTLGTRNRFSATSVDQLPHHLAAWAMFGHQLLLPVPDVDRTDFLLVLGGNPLVSNGSLMTAPGMKRRLKELRARGGRLVVVDPRRTETARAADHHLFIRPGTDALFLAALLATLFEEDLARPGRLAEMADGLEDLSRAVQQFPPEAVAEATGIEAGEIRALARDFAAAPGAVCYGRLGVSTQELGGLCQWLINALNAVTGNLDRPGGALFTRPAADLLDGHASRGHLGRWKSRVRGLPEFGGELPSAALAEEMLTDGEGRIRALVTAAGNPVLSTPDGARLERALEGLELMVSIDFYLNETTRHAHLILPPTHALEHDHYDLVFNLLAVRNVARYSPPLFAPEPGSRHDWQILHGLNRRLLAGRGAPAGVRFKHWLAGKLGPRRLLGFLLRSGPHGTGWNPLGGGLTLGKLEREAHGLDLGPLEPCLPGRLKTRDGRIQLAPEVFLGDVERLRGRLASGKGPALVLTGRRQVRSNNSWMHNFPRLMRGRDRCTLLMHPEDANRLGLDGAERVAVTSKVGRVEVPLELSDEMMPGVVSLPHGWGHGRPGTRLQVANRHPGASLNDLTDSSWVDELCGNAVLTGVPVKVEAVASQKTPISEEIPIFEKVSA